MSAPTKTHSVSKNSRDLLSADEVRRIGEREQIVIVTNKRPILGDRFWYTSPSKPAQSKKLEQVLTMDFRDEDLDGPKPDTASKLNLPPSPPKGLVS